MIAFIEATLTIITMACVGALAAMLFV